MNNKPWTLCVLWAASASLVACGSSREVEVTGEVSAGAGVAADAPVVLDFLDVIADDEAPESVHLATLEAFGAFSETVDLEGDKVLVRAIADADGDQACSAGEAWAEVEAPIADDDSVEPLTLTLTNAPCPTAE
jgi:hypothetical protein